jgi:hypothetical protein
MLRGLDREFFEAAKGPTPRAGRSKSHRIVKAQIN